jgi:endonuclease/exonuclease/phosphatase family metal-dependent hydrolase
VLTSFIPMTLALWTVFRLVGYVTEPRLTDDEIHRVDGEPTRVARPVDAGRPIKLATWNIQRGVAFENILTALRRMDADVVLLQEVDLSCERSGYREIARELARALETNWVFAGEFQEVGVGRRGKAAISGQAVLSKYPITESSAIVFAEQARLRWRLNPAQPRRGGRMALKVRTAGLLVYNAHIESGGGDRLRRSQLDQLVADHGRGGQSEFAVIAGDFNNVPAGRSTMFGDLKSAGFVDALGSDAGRRTTLNRPHGIDWIFVKNLAPTGGEVLKVADASDHYPLMVTLSRP